jgi:hypothetical protein
MEISTGVDEATWWSIAKQCEYATFFHTPLWHQLATKTYPDYRDESILIRTEDSQQNVVLPLLNLDQNSKLVRRFYSTFAGCYGDLICENPIGVEEREAIYQTINANQFTQFHITGNPIGVENKLNLSTTNTDDFTHLLILENNFDKIFSNFSKGHRSSYKKGCKMGVKVREADSIGDYKEYFYAYVDSLRRWGDNASSNYPWQLFENGFLIAKTYPQNIKLWLAEVDEKLVAGAWVFYWNKHVVWWHGAAYEAFFNYYPNNVLQTVIIKDAIERGFRYYDFNPSGGYENVARFKGRFGAEKRPFTRITINSPVLRFGQKIKRLIR